MVISTLPVFKPRLSALILITPVAPFWAFIMANASPLNAFLVGLWNDSNEVASPLSVATISPGPSTVKCSVGLLQGTINPSLSCMVAVI